MHKLVYSCKIILLGDIMANKDYTTEIATHSLTYSSQGNENHIVWIEVWEFWFPICTNPSIWFILGEEWDLGGSV